MNDTCIAYVNAAGEIKAYELFAVSDSGKYLQAIHNQQLKTFRKDRVLFTDDDLDACIQFAASAVHPIEIKKPEPPARTQVEVCFTGFSKADKEALISLAEAKDCMVRQSVTSNLDILCYGSNAGPKKMDLARAKGILILDQSEFSHLLATGEIPVFDEA
ncbi:MAG: BRCT domain-containing protein [Plesiomonas shigelloides]